MLSLFPIKLVKLKKKYRGPLFSSFFFFAITWHNLDTHSTNKSLKSLRSTNPTSWFCPGHTAGAWDGNWDGTKTNQLILPTISRNVRVLAFFCVLCALSRFTQFVYTPSLWRSVHICSIQNFRYCPLFYVIRNAC